MAVLAISEYNENYFNGRNTGVKLSWGYGDIRENAQANRFDEGDDSDISKHYNPDIKKLYDKISNLNLSNVAVLDVGGCIGNFSQEGKRLGVASWDVLDLNIDGWCDANKLPTVDSFFTGDAPVALQDKQLFKKNSYEVIFTHQFLECLEGTRLADTITEMNRISKNQQIHIITESVNDVPSQSKYNLQTIDSFWKNQGFENGTILISWNTKIVTVI